MQIQRIKQPTLEKTEEEEELARLQNALQELKVQHETELRSALDQLEGAKKKVAEDTTATSESEKSAEIEKQDLAAMASISHREFEISGQIGEPGQFDKLSYVCQIHQIDSGLEKGYSEKKVVDTVIKSISPHSSLRNDVLTSPDRSLAKLRSILLLIFIKRR